MSHTNIHTKTPARTPQKQDTLGVRLQNGFVGLVRVLHGDGLREFSQHPLLKGLKSFVVMTATHKLLILVETQSEDFRFAHFGQLLNERQAQTAEDIQMLYLVPEASLSGAAKLFIR